MPPSAVPPPRAQQQVGHDVGQRVGQVSAVCVVHQILPDPGENPDVTAIDKRPRAGRLEVGPQGLTLDSQMDRKHHGGEQQALYAYADEDAAWWAAELDQEIPPGLFGENLRIAGVEVSGAEIGERWRIGEGPDALVVEVTLPRTPCITFQRRMGRRGWIKHFTRAGRLGAYLRVVAPGTVAAGDPVTVIARPGHGVRVNDTYPPRVEPLQALVDAEAAGLVELTPKMRRHALRKLVSAGRAQQSS
jgi:MOSC domain-containing protein YiiM